MEVHEDSQGDVRGEAATAGVLVGIFGEMFRGTMFR